MPLFYDGVEIRPAPLVTITHNVKFDGTGKAFGRQYNFSLNGTIVPSGATGQLSSGMDKIVTKEKELKDLFSRQDKILSIVSPEDATKKIEAVCKARSIEFSEGIWVQVCPYKVTLTANGLVGETALGPDSNLDSFSENWSVQEQNTGVFSISHSLKAVAAESSGSLSGLAPGYPAREWCLRNSYRISGNSGSLTPVSGSVNFSDFVSNIHSGNNFWNYALIENIGATDRSWELTENFIYFSGGSAREDFSISTTQSQEDFSKSNMVAHGNIQGHANRDNDGGGKLTNASGYFNNLEPNLYTRLLNYAPSGFTLNPSPISRQVSYEHTNGTVTYDIAYVARKGGGLISGAVEEIIDINDVGNLDIFAQIQVPGRSRGPVIQNMKTVSAPTRTLNISATMTPLSGGVSVSSLRSLYLAKPNVDSIIDALKPNNSFYYRTQNDEAWNPISRKYARVISWLMDGSGVIDGKPSGINNLEP